MSNRNLQKFTVLFLEVFVYLTREKFVNFTRNKIVIYFPTDRSFRKVGVESLRRTSGKRETSCIP